MSESLTGYQQVGEFHEVFGHPLNKSLHESIFNNSKLVNFRISLIEEEINEFKEACKNHDFIEAIDAIADTMYVVYGAFHVFGVNFDDYKKHSQNPILYNISDKNTFCIELENEINKLDCYLKLLKKYCNCKMFDNVIEQLYNIIAECYTLSSLFEIDIDKCFNEVHRSNMTKVCTSQEEAIKSVEFYKTNEKRYTDPQYRLSANPKYWVVFDNATSKILKSINFELPKLNKIVNIKDF